MRWSQLHIPTLREDPADADAASHRLLLRAGFIRQLMAGHYSLLPLGIRVRAKVMAIIREEMNAIGGQEFLLPSMQPASIWEKSGRLAVMGEEMFRLKDRKGADMVLGMTHEEIFTTLATELSSYRELPQFWYQFQTKFRDEPRPKSGLIRVREFTMKDSYSFDIDEAGLDKSFEAHRRRLRADLRPARHPGHRGRGVQREHGRQRLGGVHVPDRRPARTWSPGARTATTRPTWRRPPRRWRRSPTSPARPRPVRLDTPGVRTIEDLARGYGLAADRQIKTLVQVIDGKLTLVLLRGDHPLADQKLIDATGATAIRPAQPEEIVAALGASPGSLGAVGRHRPARHRRPGAAAAGRNMATGANTDDVHLTGVDVARDITVGQLGRPARGRRGRAVPALRAAPWS